MPPAAAVIMTSFIPDAAPHRSSTGGKQLQTTSRPRTRERHTLARCVRTERQHHRSLRRRGTCCWGSCWGKSPASLHRFFFLTEMVQLVSNSVQRLF